MPLPPVSFRVSRNEIHTIPLPALGSGVGSLEKVTLFLTDLSRDGPLAIHPPLVVVVQLLSCVRLFVTPWTAARQDSLSFTISQSLLKLMSIELVMLSNHLILCRPFLLLPSIFPSISVFSNELAFLIRWPKDCHLLGPSIRSQGHSCTRSTQA